ncbi:MAG: hypothetical protein IKW11_05615 [Bacteroidales bacterium]|nr:hypothetical protein [Bacteroidales bacterium]
MKKILYSAAAMALAFLAASCQKEVLEPVVSANTVTYTVQVADAVATKALGDDVAAVNELVYEVYRTAAEETTEFTSADNLLYHKTATITNGTATIELEFVNDQNFTVLFWAQTAVAEGETPIYNVEDLTNVTITSPDAANNANAQAFVGRDFVRDCVSDANGKVTLVRPVSQLNIATTPASLNIEGQTTVALEGSSVKVTGLATSYNIATLSAFGATATEYTYTETAVPADVLTVNGKDYTYVAMNYVGFAPEMGTSDVTVSYVINTSEGNIDNEILNVPVKPNYRTNIIGNLITSKTDYTITLEKTWGEGDYYGPEFVKTPAYDEATKTWTITCRDELLYVAQQVNTGANSFVGQTVKVVNDIDLKNIPWTPIGHSTSVTFRGMFEGAAVTKAATKYPTISNLKIENGNCSGFFGLMCNGGKVRNINFNNVTISGERQLGVVVGQVYGNLEQPTIENVTVENAVITAVPALDGTVYDNGDKVGGIAGLIGQQAYIKDCTVKNSTFTGYRDLGGILGCSQNGYSCNLTGNHTENIDFVVTSQFVPYSGNTPHGATGAIRGGTRSNAADVIEGNTSSEVAEVVLVNDQVSLQNAINAAVGETNIKFVSDITGNVSVTVIQKPGVKININGDNKKYNGFIKVHSNSNYYADAALTIKNVNFETSVASTNFIEALENGSERYSTNITVEECTFTATGEGEKTSVGVQIKASKNAKVLNCTATGVHSLLQAQSCDETVVVNGCTVNGKNGVAFKQVKAATVEGTTITALEYGIRFDGNTDNYGIVVKDNNVTAVQPLIVRKMTGKNNTIALEGTNTLTTEAEYQIVITNDSDDQPYVKPTGSYTLTGADSFKLFPAIPVAKIGNTEYTSIDEAIANWTNGTTLTLIANVTLSNVIELKSTEYHVLDLGTYTMTAASKKDAIQITAEGRTSASYALDIKADATNPGGIIATGKAVVKTTGKSGVKDRPIIRFYNGVFTGTNVISHSGSNGTNCPQFQFHGGVFNGTITANRALIQFYGGTFNGSLMMSVDSSAYALISGGRFKQLNNNYGSALNSDKFTIGSAKGVFDRGVYVDDEGYFVVGGPVITDFGDMFAAKATNASKAGSYLPYSSAAANGLYYTNAAAAIAKHGEANVVLK